MLLTEGVSEGLMRNVEGGIWFEPLLLPQAASSASVLTRASFQRFFMVFLLVGASVFPKVP